METTGRSHTVYLRIAHSLKDIIAQIKTLLLLNKLTTSERDSLGCSIFRLRSRQLGRELCMCELKESLCLASACEETKKLLQGLANILLARQNTTLLFMSGFYTSRACMGTM